MPPGSELRALSCEQNQTPPAFCPLESFAVHCARYLLCAFGIEGQGQMSQGMGVGLWKKLRALKTMFHPPRSSSQTGHIERHFGLT